MSKNSNLNTEYRILNTDYYLLITRFTKIFCITLFLLSTGCHSSRKNAISESTVPGLKSWTLKYQRGPCFGQCPVYAFYLLSDNTGLIYVHANLLEPGWYTAPLDQKAVHEIMQLVEPAAWWHEDMTGQPEIADLPLLNLTYLHPDGVRTLTVQKQFSTSLSNVFEKLNKIVTEGRWVTTDMRPLESPQEPQTDVIVQLKEGVDIHQWMKTYERFGIELKKKIAPRQHYYLVRKDPAKGDSNDFLQYIKLDTNVVGAEWDKTLEQRQP
ncbi:MAG: hypothetical protein IPP15_04980 [Saprospiraceae bacterium]|uniref:DUF6438 domain-containing protein n=1 Tax=Candidatus Opimibacter skivensis TaxID=2982028 RepID=A0A9D7SRK6_9BACT|nr:hypothetical protein [Candidatus Opimibacter skivensis]